MRIFSMPQYQGVKILILFFWMIVVSSCSSNREEVDEIFFNGNIYTVDSSFTVCTAMAIKDGKIIATGTDEEIRSMTHKKATDLKGKTVIPGLHDGHCHFYGYGIDLKKIWLTDTKSFDEVLEKVNNNRGQLIGGWLFGRGWDQNKWPEKNYPDNSKLDSLFPDIPVFLLRIDGHAALANSAALKIAGISEQSTVEGGLIEKKNGKLSGILIDKAVDLVYEKIPDYSYEDKKTALLSAQKDCFSQGITFVTDAGIENTGLRLDILNLIDSLHKKEELLMRINAMGAIEDFEHYRKNGKIKTEKLSVQGFKIYADGALGSRGACLISEYKDQPGHKGFLIHSPAYLDSVAGQIASIGFQMNTHCIGDSSHRLMLDIYGQHSRDLRDHRWRIEHAQVIHPADLEKYRLYKVVPSVQPVHATSDMYWAEERIGTERIKGAYAYLDLLKQNNLLVSGSDFPVEEVNPFHGIHAAIARKDKNDFPENGFQPSNKLSREDALRSFTIWPAYGAFRETESGSLEKGKNADFIVIDRDIMKVQEKEIRNTLVLSTYVDGRMVYQRK